MHDEELTRAFARLDPAAPARARIETKLLADLEAAESALVDEWLDLIRVRPLAALGYTAAAAIALLVASPVAAVALALLT